MIRVRGLLMSMLCVATFSACGQGGSSTAANDPGDAAQSSLADVAAKAYDPDVPLRAEDISLYLTVMRAAAERVRHPTAADRAAIERAKADEAASAKAMQANQAVMDKVSAEMQVSQAAAQRGDMDAARAAAHAAIELGAGEQSPQVDANADTLADDFRGGMVDGIIVQQRHINPDRYDSIVSRVEQAVPNPCAAVGSGDGGEVMTAAPRQAEAAYEAALATWRTQLAPHRSEIAALEKVVREPHYGP